LEIVLNKKKSFYTKRKERKGAKAQRHEEKEDTNTHFLLRKSTLCPTKKEKGKLLRLSVLATSCLV